MDFDLNGPEIATAEESTTIEEAAKQPTSLMGQFLLLHQRMGHISFNRLREMAKQGTIPKKFAKAPDPACTCCLYGKMTKRAWRTKGQASTIMLNELRKILNEFIDVITSPNPTQTTQKIISEQSIY